MTRVGHVRTLRQRHPVSGVRRVKNDNRVTNGSSAYFSYDTFVKEGYSSNLLKASFYVINAAV